MAESDDFSKAHCSLKGIRSQCYWSRAFLKSYKELASLVVQWLRICLLMQGTQVQALIWKDPTCH